VTQVVCTVKCPVCDGTGYTVRLDGWYTGDGGVSGEPLRLRVSKRRCVQEARAVIEQPNRRNRFLTAVSRWRKTGASDVLSGFGYAQAAVSRLKHYLETNKIMEEPCPNCNTTGWSLRVTTAGPPVRDSHER